MGHNRYMKIVCEILVERFYEQIIWMHCNSRFQNELQTGFYMKFNWEL